MAKADELGISDISYTKVKSIIGAFIYGLKEKEIMSIRLQKLFFELGILSV